MNQLGISNPQMGGAAAGYPSTGMCHTNATQPKERRLEACIKRFDHLLACYADLATHAEQLALGLAGPSPEPAGGIGAATPEPIALIGRLEYLADQFEGRRQRIHVALTRLSEL